MAIFPGEPELADFIGPKVNGGGGDNWSYKTCKAPITSSPPTNQRPTFYRSRMPFLSPNQQSQSIEGKRKKYLWLQHRNSAHKAPLSRRPTACRRRWWRPRWWRWRWADEWWSGPWSCVAAAWARRDLQAPLPDCPNTSDISVLKLISVLAFILFSSQNFYFI